ncbi:hypothetical protein KIW84_023459 [Lathyrus oleraceus]|uniref:Uncharacterized protein n=1 Tax=Pisum sativum TaxID=3888 RepID=A0A9D4YD09_PEA|nr:hypothetical protein KIW84_023459 [Pisum sativum]
MTRPSCTTHLMIADSGIHRYGTRRNQQRAMEGVQAELAEMRARMTQFMDVVQGVAQGQQELRQIIQGNPPAQPKTVTDPPAGEVNGPSGPGPIPIPHANPGQQPVHDDQDDQFPPLQEDFGMGHGVDPMFRRLEERLKAVEGQNPLGVDVADLGLVPGQPSWGILGMVYEAGQSPHPLLEGFGGGLREAVSV